MRTRVVLLAALGTAACTKEVVDPISAVVDHQSPKSVLGGVFFAARSGDPTPLVGLCDPGGASEPSVRRLCELVPDDPDWASFRAAFAPARINGEPRVHGDHAALSFVFGPRADESESMELIRRGGRWYLLRF